MKKNIVLTPGEYWGVGVAMATIMEPGISATQPIDKERQEMLTRDLIDALASDRLGENGLREVDGFLVVAGTTGKSPVLGHIEQQETIEEVFDVAVKYCAEQGIDQIPIVGGIGSNCTAESINLLKGIEERIGPSTCLANTGYYVIGRGPQEGIEDHFNYIADESKGNILLYHVDSRGCYIAPETIIRLSKHQHIAGLKEADGDRINGVTDGMCTLEMIDAIKDPFSVVSGEDYEFARILNIGGKGIVSAGATVATMLFVGLWRAYKEGDLEKVKEYQIKINDFSDNCTFSTKNPIGVDHPLKSGTRPPLTTLERANGGKHVAGCEAVVEKYSEHCIDVSRY